MGSDWKDDVFEKWWPLTQATTLVRAPIDDVAQALEGEGDRATDTTAPRFTSDWVSRNSIDEFFEHVEKQNFDGSLTFALPTTGAWTIVWNNSRFCTPEHLGHRLTKFQQLETIGFYATDQKSTQSAGTHFTHNKPGPDGENIVRDVYCCSQGSRWHFEQRGEPLPEEDVASYSARRKRDRMNEAALMALLERLGVHPWREETYDFQKKCFLLKDTLREPNAEQFTFENIRAKALGQAAPQENDKEIFGPPNYLLEKCTTATDNEPTPKRRRKWPAIVGLLFVLLLALLFYHVRSQQMSVYNKPLSILEARFAGDYWPNGNPAFVRTFAADRTLSTSDGQNLGYWRIDDGQLTLTMWQSFRSPRGLSIDDLVNSLRGTRKEVLTYAITLSEDDQQFVLAIPGRNGKSASELKFTRVDGKQPTKK